MILLEIDGAPLAVFDAVANLRGRFTLTRLFVRVQSFPDADAAFRRVFAREAIEQASMSLAAIAVAIARLLIQALLDSRGGRVRILHDNVGERVRA